MFSQYNLCRCYMRKSESSLGSTYIKFIEASNRSNFLVIYFYGMSFNNIILSKIIIKNLLAVLIKN